MHRLTQSKYYPLILYTIGLVVALLSIHYFQYLFNHASGVHFWRQADSVSFVAHYYERGMHFFEPGTYDVNAIDGHGASEFPIFYYLTAALWHVFGRHDSILKIIHSLVFFSGFYCFFKIAIKQIGNIYTAFALTFLLLTSSVLLFYANSFLPDPAALGLCLIGAYFYFRFADGGEYKNYVVAFAFFTLSVLIKVNMAVMPVAIVCLVLLEKVFKVNLKIPKLFDGNIIKYLAPAVVMVALCSSWVLWTINYNQINHNYVFLTNIRPYWKASAEEIANTKTAITGFWYPQYYSFKTWYLIYFIALIGLLNIKKWTAHNRWLCFGLIMGSVAYMLFFFTQFQDHDYYTIPLLVPIAFALLFSLSSLSNRFTRLKTSYIPAIIIVLFAVAGFRFMIPMQEYRTDFARWSNMNPEVFEISGKLENYGIPKGEQIFCFPDRTPNGSLYYLQRQGYTNSSGYDVEQTAPILKRNISYGIRYLVITNPAYFHLAKSSWFECKEVGSYKNIRMYYILWSDIAKAP